MQRERVLAAVCGSQRIVVALIHRAADSRLTVEDAAAYAVSSSAVASSEENDEPVARAGRSAADAPARAAVVGAPPTGTEPASPIASALRLALADPRWRGAAARVARLVVAPPSRDVLLKTVRTPDVAAAARRAVLVFEAEQILPSAAATLAWAAAPLGRDGDAFEHALAVAKQDSLAPLLDALPPGLRRRAGFVPLPLALLESEGAVPPRVFPAETAPAGPAGRDATTTTSVGAEPACCVLIVADPAASVVVVRAAERTQSRIVPHAAPETAGPGEAERVAAELARAVAVARRQLGAERCASLQLAGDAALATALAERLPAKLGAATAELVAPDAAIADSAAAVPAAELFGAVALAAAGARDSAGQLALPVRATSAGRPSRALRNCARAAAVIVAVAPALAAGWLAWNVAGRRADTKALAAEIAPLRRRADERRVAEAELAAVRARLDAWSRADAASRRWPALFARLAATLGAEPGVRLERLEPVAASNSAPTNAGWFSAPAGAAPTRASALPGPDDGLRVRFAGTVRRTPADAASALRRVQALFARLTSGDGPVAAVERVRYDDASSDLLRFEADLVLRLSPPVAAAAAGFGADSSEAFVGGRPGVRWLADSTFD